MAVAMASYAILFILISPSVVRGRPVPESGEKMQSIIQNLAEQASMLPCLIVTVKKTR